MRNPSVAARMLRAVFSCLATVVPALWGDSVLLHCCICGRTGLLPYMERNRNDEENLSTAAYMDYTSSVIARTMVPGLHI